jgi:hypothetical protein
MSTISSETDHHLIRGVLPLSVQTLVGCRDGIAQTLGPGWHARPGKQTQRQNLPWWLCVEIYEAMTIMIVRQAAGIGWSLSECRTFW